MSKAEPIQNIQTTEDSSAPSASEMTPLWTIEEVADYLRVKAETVRAMARRGEIPAVKIGRVWRIPQAQLIHFIQTDKQEVKLD